MEQIKYKTACWVLYNKGLLNDTEIYNEVTFVAPKYNKNIELGYITLIAPIIFVLNRTGLFDKIVLYFVKKWMKSHQDESKSHIIREYFIWMCETVGRFRRRLGLIEDEYFK